MPRTRQSFAKLIKGQEDYVYVWALGVEGLGDGSEKLVTVDVLIRHRRPTEVLPHDAVAASAGRNAMAGAHRVSRQAGDRLGSRALPDLPGLGWYREAHNDYVQTLV